MKTTTFLTIIMGLLSYLTEAQQPTAYIPESPTKTQPNTALCTPPPGATCTPSNQTSPKTPGPHFSPTWPAILHPPPSAYTLIPSLLSSLQHSWSSSPSFPSLCSAIYVAAPTSAQLSLAVSGYNWDNIVQAPWYGDVGQQWRDEVTKQEEVLQSAFDAATGDGYGNGSGTGKENGGNLGGGRVDGAVLGWVLVFMVWIWGVGLL